MSICKKLWPFDPLLLFLLQFLCIRLALIRLILSETDRSKNDIMEFLVKKFELAIWLTQVYLGQQFHLVLRG